MLTPSVVCILFIKPTPSPPYSQADMALLQGQLLEAKAQLAEAERAMGTLSRQSGEAEVAAQQAKRVEGQVRLDLDKWDANSPWVGCSRWQRRIGSSVQENAQPRGAGCSWACILEFGRLPPCSGLTQSRHLVQPLHSQQVLDLLAKIEALKAGLAGRDREVACAREASEVAEQQLAQAQAQLEEAQQQVRRVGGSCWQGSVQHSLWPRATRCGSMAVFRACTGA